MQILKGENDVEQARLYWGAMPLPAGSEIIGLVSRTEESGAATGAAILINDRVWQGNAGALKSLDQDVTK